MINGFFQFKAFADSKHLFEQGLEKNRQNVCWIMLTWYQSHVCSRSQSTQPVWRPQSRCWPAAWGRDCPGCRAFLRSSGCLTGSGSSSILGVRWSPPGPHRAGHGSSSPARRASAAPVRPSVAERETIGHYFNGVWPVSVKFYSVFVLFHETMIQSYFMTPNMVIVVIFQLIFKNHFWHWDILFH